MDKQKILSKIDEINQYLEEIEQVAPSDFEEYESSIEKKRACERILQILIENVIDICNIITSESKLGMPSDEEDMLKKLAKKGIISGKMEKIIHNMKGFRNILVHKYAEVKDELVFEMIKERLSDFEKFKEEILIFIQKEKKEPKNKK